MYGSIMHTAIIPYKSNRFKNFRLHETDTRSDIIVVYKQGNGKRVYTCTVYI
jgi:hypothetical protein